MKISSPVAGVVIIAGVVLGSKSPRLELEISSMAEPSGSEPGFAETDTPPPALVVPLEAERNVEVTSLQVWLLKKLKLLVVVLYNSSPVAGEGIRFLAAVVSLGIRIPLSSDLTSSMADGSAGLPLALMPTCAYVVEIEKIKLRNRRRIFIIERF